MESRVKYLDELILAIKSSAEENVTFDSFPPRSSMTTDLKSMKVIDILLKNLVTPRLSSSIFARSLEALDLLLRRKPYLLFLSMGVPDKTEEVGIIWILTQFIKVSCIQWGSPTFLWTVKQKIGRWCNIYSNLTDLESKTLISGFIFGQLTRLEAQITSVFSSSQDEIEFTEACRKIYILCDWCSQPELQISTPLLNTALESSKWDNYFQRLVRVVYYVLDSVTVEHVVLQELQTRYLTLVASYAINRGTKHVHLRRAPSTDAPLRFSLETISSFMLAHTHDLLPENDACLAKTLIRLYLIATAQPSAAQIFFDIMSFDRYCDANQESFTQRAALLITFDRKRRIAASSELVQVEGIVLFGGEKYQSLQAAALTPFPHSRQLELLRKAVLNAFRAERSDLDLADLAAVGFSSDVKSPEVIFFELDTKIDKAFKQKNFQALVHSIRLLGKLACFELDATTIEEKPWQHCFLCDNSLPSKSFNSYNLLRPDASTKSRAFKIMSKHFVKNQHLNDFGESLLGAIIIALRRIFMHFQPPELIVNDNSALGTSETFNFVKRVFSIPNRYLRLLAVPLMSSTNNSSAHDFEDRQTTFLIELLQNISTHSLTETVLMSWVRLTLTTRGDSFDPLLVKLVDIFNSTNFAERCMMTHQLRYISWLKKATPYRLLSPILPLILKQIGKNIKEKKLSLQRLADFVEYPSKTILENFQKYIVPYAITQYKDDVITEISSILCDYEPNELSIQKDRLLSKNSRQIFAVALVKHGFFSIDTLESLFVNCLPTFDRSYVAAYLPDYKTLAEILKLYKNYDTNEHHQKDNDNMVLCALRFLFNRYDIGKRRASKHKLLSEWSNDNDIKFQKKLQDNILGIFQVFSSDMHDVEGRTTYFEKLRVINGIHFLIIHASSECLISALAQISICLQSGQEVPEIQDNAFKCWLDLIKRLTQEQLSTVVDSFVPFTLQKWTTFSVKVKKTLNDILGVLINDKRELVLNSRPYITLALVNMTELNILEDNRSFARLVNRALYTTDWFTEYANNLKSKNKYLVRQILKDVKSLLLKKQLESLLQSTSNGASKADISILLGSLLDTCYRFRSEDLDLCRECTAIIGVIGVLDVTKHQLPRSSAHIRDVFDFGDHAQTVKFLINITNDILVPAFWESENPTKQLFVALVMQESLKFCGLSSSSWDIQKPELYPHETRLWGRFNDIAKTTLYPLRSSLYMAQSWKEYSPIRYPSFNPKVGYRTWLKNLTLDLLKTGTDESHPLHVFSSLIREDDGFLSENLLPYIVIDILIKAEEETSYCDYAKNLKAEFTYIFEFDLSSLNHYQLDSIKLCYEIVFKVLEYCKKWITQFNQSYSRKHGTFTIRENKYLKMIHRINDFLEMAPFGLMAQRSLETDSFERSALYLEQSYRVKDREYFGNDKLLSYLQTTYAEIGDIDSVEGVLKIFSTGSVASKIEELQYSHNWGMAQQCFEALGRITEPTKKYEGLCISGNTKMLKSMYNHQQYDQVVAKLVTLVPSQTSQANEYPVEWISMGIESAYLSGQHDNLKRWIRIIESFEQISDPMTLLHYNFSKVLMSLCQNERDEAMTYTQRCHKLIGAKFSTLSVNTTLLKIRDIVLRLHAIRDLWIVSDPSLSFQVVAGNQVLDKRLENVGADFEPRHFLLSIQKSYNLLKCNEAGSTTLAENFFKLAQNARINSRADLASGALIHALIYEYPSADLEYAEVLWNQGENDKAIKLVGEIHQKMNNKEGLEPRERAKVFLKYTEWLDLSNNSISEQIIKQYNDVIRLDPGWSEPYYSLGLYFSRLLERRSAEGYISNGRFETKSISFFLLSFEKDTTRTREALPKVVTFWLDTANLLSSETNAGRKDSLKRSVEEICKRMEIAIKNCPTYIWYSVLTQILSRLLHSHKASVQLMMQILLNLAIEYPSHILWYLSVLLNSTSSTRLSVGKHIVEQFRQNFPDPNELLSYSDDLVKHLTNVCMKDVKSSNSRSGRSLDKDFDFNLKLAPCPMTVPVNANLEMLTPTSSESLAKFQPFGRLITIAKIGSSYKVYSSLKKPKKLNFVGSDGKIYGIMCKKEDVRQDNQYMQFSTTMDFLLSKDLASRKRNLGITTYAIVSLREDCGLIEIVPNVTTLRSILVTKYDGMKIKYSLKSLHDKWQTLPDDQKLGFFKDLCAKFPPVLYEWFLETFPDAIAWYKARNTFSRSYAVMAMVGHILGLGDRHCENILLDVETGKVLHVDFDCLFEKGKRLPIPEIVPFRLTQNLEDALGISGTEGTFKRSSQVTLELMRDNEVALVNIIETIMYDRNMDHSLHKALKVIRNKIRGIDSRDGLVLSIAGQVETVTQESTSEENLSRMYIGWLPFW
ncbi:LANO_0G10484g1_1 [Lachancea nothofagi CBS 11611]|uniref:Serine/threonine-protein kinase MEC1 n=1 Tax=Lachancea nothofagi CBS 11611 TaxID=1266666 RepID=A0A1G4KIZ8_9SACH|nr:LANO_0G10484g1_1 [Lachancea nothofagi CBS 11611]